MAANLQGSVVPLIHGLDLTSPKLVAPQGSLIDCLNYELVDFAGYKRIDGFERYDGFESPSITEYYRASTAADTSAYTVGDILGRTDSFTYLGGGGGSQVEAVSYFGILVAKGSSGSTNYLYFVPFKGTPAPNAGTFQRLVAGVLQDDVTVTDVEEGREYQPTEADYISSMITYQNIVRGLIGSLPTVAVGLHWFTDRLYAVAGARQLISESFGAGPIGTPVVGQVITGSGGSTGLVISATSTSGAGGRAFVTIIDYNTGDWVGETVPSILGDPGGLDVLLPIDSLSGNSSLAHLWEAMNPFAVAGKYSVPPDLGWRAINHGWYFNYEDGDDAADFLLKRERNSNSSAIQLYYFSDGSTTFEAYINSYTVDSGSFAGGDATGVMQVGELNRTAGTSWTINASYSIYSDAGLSIKVGEVSSTMAFNNLPGISQLDAQDSRYEFITANFYAVEALEAMYGVSGASRAFYYDKTFFATIYTGVLSSFPRHIANYLGHLALAYKEGSVDISVVGEPWNFDAVEGASSQAVGDRITGLSILQGTTLGIFCEQSVWSLSGSTVDSFNLQILVPNVGCLEYSLVDMGQPVFCTNWGISTLEQSAKYGDFAGARLSTGINTWLIPKLVNSTSGRKDSAGVLCAIPVRAKNQYRLFLKDGSIVSMTMGGEGPAAFTFQKYNWPTDSTKFVKPIATSSQIDQFGKERIHFSTWDILDGDLDFVYESDIGWSFDGSVIPAYFDTNWYFNGNVADVYQTIASVRLHGLVLGYASLNVFASGIESDYNSMFSTRPQPINLDRNKSLKLYDSYEPATNIVDLAKRGLGIQLRFQSSASFVEPPHVCQVLTIQTRSEGLADL